ncbi:FAD-binding domain-containing protein [Basidiobolus meristosporus CBS 931.73]|uniref:D-arabinono-1,4-lactone oxidase n=1 Tax=Basidiobolus meristosporus CBS 931.73 TaxID=1314790 RepID=A0A1Y1WWL2_9FUNG|nr:FAD-binding domain-containing protein [Basidiobolus meristosporus CBS 931.73]|eukprot:ORX77920.1 FAD-binding domain-containing protein [Basidiobolus meristosporus CBS 931.73]
MTKRAQFLALLGACALLSSSMGEELSSKYTSFNRYISCNSQKMVQPSSVFEMQRIVRNAYSNRQHVKGIGHLHSASDIICTDGVVVNTDCLRDIKISRNRETVTAQAGVRVVDLLKHLNANGLGIVNMPNFGEVTVAGALGTGAHGSSLKHVTAMSDMVVSMRVVTGTGELKTITGSLLDAFRVHIGAVGLVYDVTFKVIPAYKVHVQNYPVPESQLLDGTLEAMAEEYDLFQAWWFPGTSTVVASNGTYVPVTQKGEDRWNFISSMDPKDVTGLVNSFEQVQATRNLTELRLMEADGERSFWTTTATKLPIYANPSGGLSNPAVGFPHDMMTQTCNPCFWDPTVNKVPFDIRDISMGFPMEHLKDVVRDIQEILKRYPAYFPFNGIWFRFSPPTNGWMSLSYGRKTVHIEFITPSRIDNINDPRLGLEATQLIGQTLINKYDARPHWGKNGQYYFSHEVRAAAHPKLKDFARLVRRYDPRGVFSNDFTNRIFNDIPSKLNPAIKHCALEDSCLCSSDNDCANGQVCAKEDGFRFCTFPN